jgi:putative FmdB family regulatory protein
MTGEGRWLGIMPFYDYKCGGCKKTFSLILSIAEHDKGKVKCPKCGSAKVRQQVTGFSVITSKKS